MKTLHLICVDFRRCIFSFRFFVSVLGVPALMLAAIVGIMEGASSVWYLARLSLQGSGIDGMIECTLPVFAFGLSYAAEWEEKAERYWVIRTGTGGYALSKTLNCAISGFLTIFLGIGIFVLMLLPLYPAYAPFGDSSYEMLMAEGKITGWLLYMTHQGLTGAMTAVCGLWFSTWLPNRFATAAAPFILYFSLLRITGRMKLPPYLDPINWCSGMYDAETCLGTIVVKFTITFLLCAVMGGFAKLHIDRRLLRE